MVSVPFPEASLPELLTLLRSLPGPRWFAPYSERSSFFWRERKRWRYLGPLFLYVSDPAFKKASQICATLRPSRAAIVSRLFFKSDRTRNDSLVSFFIGRKFYHCFLLFA